MHFHHHLYSSLEFIYVIHQRHISLKMNEPPSIQSTSPIHIIIDIFICPIASLSHVIQFHPSISLLSTSSSSNPRCIGAKDDIVTMTVSSAAALPGSMIAMNDAERIILFHGLTRRSPYRRAEDSPFCKSYSKSSSVEMMTLPFTYLS